MAANSVDPSKCGWLACCVLAALGFILESHIAKGVFALQFPDVNRVPIPLPLEDHYIWQGAQEAIPDEPKSIWLHDPTLLPHIGVDCSSFMFRPPLAGILPGYCFGPLGNKSRLELAEYLLGGDC